MKPLRKVHATCEYCVMSSDGLSAVARGIPNTALRKMHVNSAADGILFIMAGLPWLTPWRSSPLDLGFKAIARRKDSTALKIIVTGTLQLFKLDLGTRPSSKPLSLTCHRSPFSGTPAGEILHLQSPWRWTSRQSGCRTEIEGI